jgi:hypothetical protein
MNLVPKNDMDGFLDGLLSVAKIAVPIAGTLIASM